MTEKINKNFDVNSEITIPVHHENTRLVSIKNDCENEVLANLDYSKTEFVDLNPVVEKLSSVGTEIESGIEDIWSSILHIFGGETKKDAAIKALWQNNISVTKEEINHVRISDIDSNRLIIKLCSGEEYHINLITKKIEIYMDSNGNYVSRQMIENCLKRNGIENYSIYSFSIESNFITVALENGNTYLFNAENYEILRIIQREHFYDIGETVVTDHVAGDIFSIENSTGQYGGNQMVFKTNTEDLLENADIRKILLEAFPNASEEDYYLYLKKVCNVGCAYVASINCIFAKYNGREQDFFNTFGIDMYRTDSFGKVVFNYEPLVLDWFTYLWHDLYGMNIQQIYGNIGGDTTDSAISGEDSKGATGLSTAKFNKFEAFLKYKYGVSVDISTISNTDASFGKNDFEGLIGKNIICSSKGFDLYEIDTSTGERGVLACENVGGHAMYITGFTTSGDMIISSWGKQYILDISSQEWSYIQIVDIYG